jgi:hypothetical protein
MAPFFTSDECDAGWRFAYTGLRAEAVPGGASLTQAYNLWSLLTVGPASLRRRAKGYHKKRGAIWLPFLQQYYQKL